MKKPRASESQRQDKSDRYRRSLEMINPDAGFIDIGSGEHWACFSADEGDAGVRQFGAYTSELYALRDWFLKHGTTSVAMESTGVYWIPIYQILQDAGLEVLLVNAHDLKSVKGRPKTDRLDCQWGQRLHRYGLLRGSFRPAPEICRMRSIWRTRDQWLQDACRCVQRMQKALHEMNLLLPKVVSDITGKTGMAIIRAIVEGEHDPVKLAENRDPRIRKSEKEIAEALRGDYRPELLFVLKKELEHYDFIIGKLADFDTEVHALLEQFPKHHELSEEDKKANRREHDRYKRRNHHAPTFDSCSILHEVVGVDLAAIPGFSSLLIANILLEIGWDVSKWPSEHHFASWLGLCPQLRISGGKNLHGRTKKCASRAARFFRQAAATLRQSETYLGDFYRRIRSRHGDAYAITATAHKLAIIFYRMLRDREQFRLTDRTAYRQAIQQLRLKNLQKRAKNLGFELSATTESAKEMLAQLEQLEHVS